VELLPRVRQRSKAAASAPHVEGPPLALQPPALTGGAETQRFLSEHVKASGHAAEEQSLVHAPVSHMLDWQSPPAAHDAPRLARRGFGPPSGHGSWPTCAYALTRKSLKPAVIVKMFCAPMQPSGGPATPPLPPREASAITAPLAARSGPPLSPW